MSEFEIHFGGPDRIRGCLRDVLAERIASVPAGGHIDWVTYYFRDRRLATDLVHARERGVNVQVTLDGRPRTPNANNAVCAILREGLGDGLRLVAAPTDTLPLGQFLRPRLHEKLYCFSHPRPVAYIGSFNPSSDDPELQPEVIRAVGDQDRGHNVLVGYFDEGIVSGLVRHARLAHSRRYSGFDRFRPVANRLLCGEDVTIHFQPRISPNPVFTLLERCGSRHRVRIAASHLSGRRSVRCIADLAGRGAQVEVLAEATHRRVPPWALTRLRNAGVDVRRAVDTEGLPMHAKFALIDSPDERLVIFGSFNWTSPSQRTNFEIGATSSDPKLIDAFEGRWLDLEHYYGATDASRT